MKQTAIGRMTQAKVAESFKVLVSNTTYAQVSHREAIMTIDSEFTGFFMVKVTNSIHGITSVGLIGFNDLYKTMKENRIMLTGV